MVNSRILPFVILHGLSSVFAGERPALFLSGQEAQQIRANLPSPPLLNLSVQKTKMEVDLALAKSVEVPPPGEAGGYEHERHKQNYRDMFNAGLMFRITGEEKYATLVRQILDKYADLYPKLGPHPLAHNQAPGKLFHQTLNEEVWLVHTSIAYDCIRDWLSSPDRQRFERNIFRPMMQWFSEHNENEFNRIHNHGTWAVAAVGMMGLVLGDDAVVEKALYGTKKDGHGGFIKQLDMLFSPDGYYMEGPYYVRYALSPFFLFAEALERFRPLLRIYEYRDRILKKAFYAAAQTIFPNGVFPPINDASRTMDIRDVGPLLANDLVYFRYGADPNLLAMTALQGEVILNGAGLAVAKDFVVLGKLPRLAWKSVEFTDGFDGKRGGMGILRMGEGPEQTMLVMKYGVHGEGHGHFDKLHFILFDQGREVVPDYGFARWINVEPKFGGRYLPENDSYAMQTIAHNTVVVDETSQNRAVLAAAEQVSGQRHFFDATNEAVQVMSARADDYYPGVAMQRTMLLIRDPKLDYPVVVDLFRLASEAEHTYDYPIHFRGQLIAATFEYQSHVDLQKPLGVDFGYQHIWREASGKTDEAVGLTWLEGHRYYSVLSSSAGGTEVLFGRTGANDPNFNLTSEPLVILRRRAADHLFASVIEPHGYFNEAQEKSDGARPSILNIKIIGHNDEGTVVEVAGKEAASWHIMVNNGPAGDETHELTFNGTKYAWRGNYAVRVRGSE